MAIIDPIERIKINEFPATSEPLGIFVTSGADGIAHQISEEDFKEWLGTVTVITDKPIALSDPAPTLDGVYLPTEAGTYTNAGGLVYDPEGVDEGMYVQFIKNDTAWTKLAVELPMQDISNLATKDEVQLLETPMVPTKNHANYREFFGGRWSESTGEQSPSDNWLGMNLVDVSDYVGQQIVASGVKGLTELQARFVFINSVGGVVSYVLGEGNQTVEFTSQSATVPSGAVFVGTNIANAVGIGINPTQTDYTNTAQLELGTDTPTEFEPFGYALDVEKINYPVKTEIEANANKIGSVTITSKNLVDMTTEAIRGRYVAGTGALSGIGSVNWLATPRILVTPDQIGKPFTISGIGSFSSGSAIASVRNSDGNVIYEVLGSGPSTPNEITFIMPSGAHDLGGTINNGVGTSEDLYDNEFTNKYQIEQGDTATTPIPKGQVLLDGSKIINWPEGLGSFNINEVVAVKESSDTYSIYFHSGGENNKWLEVQWLRITDPVKYIDTWKLNEVWGVTRTDQDAFSRDMKIVRQGVWENAIYTSGSGYTDAIGSLHGCEVLTNATFFVDEKEISSDASNTVWYGRTFRAFQSSSFTNADGTGQIGVSLKEWSLKDGLIAVKNTIPWKGSLNITWNSYLSMLSILRVDPDTSVQVTHSAIPNDDMVEYDVSVPGFTTDIYWEPSSSTGPSNPLRNNIAIWGDDVKAEMFVKKREVVKANGDHMPLGLPDTGMFVQNSALYNKLYGPFGSMAVVDGDLWRVETEYRISYK